MRKTKVKTETGIVVEIKATENIPKNDFTENVVKKDFAENLQTSRLRDNPIINEKVVEKKEEKPYISATNTKVYRTVGEPIWKAKPENTDKNTRIYPKKHLQMPIFKEENIETPENKQIEKPILAEKPMVLPAKKEISKEDWAEKLVLQKKPVPVIKEKEITSSIEEVLAPVEKESLEKESVEKESVEKEPIAEISVPETKVKTKTTAKSKKKKKSASTENEAIKEEEVPVYDEPEIWADVKEGDDGKYRVSNYGRVTSSMLHGKTKFIKGKVQKKFCNVIELNKDGKIYGIGISRLVALYFVPNPENKTHVIHIDRNYQNNYYKNLQWVTHKEICERKTWEQRRGKSKISYDYAVQIRKMIDSGIPQHKIAKMFCISSMQVTRIKREENWRR